MRQWLGCETCGAMFEHHRNWQVFASDLHAKGRKAREGSHLDLRRFLTCPAFAGSGRAAIRQAVFGNGPHV